jgi:hypothetical protein
VREEDINLMRLELPIAEGNDLVELAYVHLTTVVVVHRLEYLLDAQSLSRPV